MMAPVVEKVLGPVQLGEGPHWDAASQTLYYVDIEGNKLIKYVPTTKERTSVTLDDKVGFAVPVEGKENVFVVAIKKRVALVTWDGKSEHPQLVENLFEVQKEPGKDHLRINDGKADPSGRIWFGTMGYVEMGTVNEGKLFSMGQNLKPQERQTDVGLSNGLAWTKDTKTMFYIDSLKRSVDAMDFDITTGAVSNRRTIFDLEKNGISGFPDGMTIDEEDKLWVAVYDGGKVLRINPTNGCLMTSVDIPAGEVTSVTFGGPNLDELYVTSAAVRVTRETKEKYPDGGSLFRITGLGVRGYPGRAARL